MALFYVFLYRNRIMLTWNNVHIIFFMENIQLKNIFITECTYNVHYILLNSVLVLSEQVNCIDRIHFLLYTVRGRRGRDCMVVGFTTTYAISAYHH